MFNQHKKNARLGQWDGRRRSSRSEEPVLPCLWQRPVLLRLAPVLAAALLVTFLAYEWGTPLPYRVGQVYPRDLRVRAYFELVNQTQTEHARDEAVESLPPDLSEDPQAREAARLAVPPVVEKYSPGMLLMPRGQPLTERQLTLLEEEYRAFQRGLGTADHARRAVALFLVMGMLSVVVVLYVVRFQPGLAESLTKIATVCVLVVVTLPLALA